MIKMNSISHIEQLELQLDKYSDKNFNINNIIIKTIEELSELTKELSKNLLCLKFQENTFNELIDCEIMLNQLKFSFEKRFNVNFLQIKYNKLIEINNKFLFTIEND